MTGDDAAGPEQGAGRTPDDFDPLQAEQDRATAKSPTRRVVEAVVGLGLAVVLLVWGLPYFAKTSWADIWSVVQTIPWTSFVLYQSLMLVGLYCYTFTFTGSLRGLRHGQALIVNLCGSSVSNLLPGGGAVGLAATYAILRSWGFTSAIVTGVWNVMARIALPVIAIFALWVGNKDLPSALADAAVAALITGTLILTVFIAVLASERAALATGAFLDKVLRPLYKGRRKTMSVTDLVRDLRNRINDVVRHGWLPMTLGMIGFFGLYYVLFVLIMHETGVTLPLGMLFAGFAISRVLTAVGITPGGLGVTETATSAALVAWGADPAAATAGVVLFSLFTHIMEVPLGGLGWLLWTVSPKTEPPAEGAEPLAH